MQKNKQILLTNVFKNANINAVAGHTLKIFVEHIWRGGRVGLWHQS